MLTTPGIGFIDREEITAINRTGSALTAGGVYALDITRTDATNSTDADSSLKNVVACATANLRGILVVALGATAAAAAGRFVVKGLCSVLIDGTTDVAVGDKLVPQNASNAVIKQAATSLVNNCGFTLTAQTTDAATLTANVWFDGYTYQGEKAAS